MISQQKKLSLIQCIIASSCLFPLFFYAKAFASIKLGPYLVVLHDIGSLTAFFAFFFLLNKKLSFAVFCFWMLMAVSPLAVSLCFVFWSGQFNPIWFLLLFWGIQFLFPAIHIIRQTQKKKHFFRYILVCFYVFSLAIGCTILLFRKECHFEFFPIAALSGILLELSFLKSTENVSDEQTKSKSLNSKSSDKG